jgi:flavin reductase (DIM6/NTAB) family NADH-FMN oxidoreductase RutF
MTKRDRAHPSQPKSPPVSPPETRPVAIGVAAAVPARPGAIDTREFRTALGSFATGVTIVTAMGPEGRPVGLTCNSFASVSLNPPLILWSLVTHSTSLPVFQEASHFAVNILGASQDALALQFARSTADKFAGVSWTPGLGGAPVLTGCVAHFQCRSADRYYGGDHVIFLGAVEDFAHSRDQPLLFSRGKFGSFVPDAAK